MLQVAAPATPQAPTHSLIAAQAPVSGRGSAWEGIECESGIAVVLQLDVDFDEIAIAVLAKRTFDDDDYDKGTAIEISEQGCWKRCTLYRTNEQASDRLAHLLLSCCACLTTCLCCTTTTSHYLSACPSPPHHSTACLAQPMWYVPGVRVVLWFGEQEFEGLEKHYSLRDGILRDGDNDMHVWRAALQCLEAAQQPVVATKGGPRGAVGGSAAATEGDEGTQQATDAGHREPQAEQTDLQKEIADLFVTDSEDSFVAALSPEGRDGAPAVKQACVLATKQQGVSAVVVEGPPEQRDTVAGSVVGGAIVSIGAGTDTGGTGGGGGEVAGHACCENLQNWTCIKCTFVNEATSEWCICGSTQQHQQKEKKEKKKKVSLRAPRRSGQSPAPWFE